MPSLMHKRGTRAQINAAAAAGGLKTGEIYLITDEARLTVGTASGAHQACAKQSDLGWSSYVSIWSSTPVKIAATPSGDVYKYTRAAGNYYRLVPSPYTPAQDAFYSNYTAGVLSGLLASRG